MESNLMTSKHFIGEKYFQSNQIIVNQFFEKQRKMYELQQAHFIESNSPGLFLYLMELNKTIVLNTLDAQKHGALNFWSDHPNTSSSEISDPQTEIIGIPSKLVLEQWLKRKLSKITGYPAEKITGEMKFEKDLGLVSSDVVELFYHLIEEFPDLNKDLTDVAGAVSVQEFLGMMLQDHSHKEDKAQGVSIGDFLKSSNSMFGFEFQQEAAVANDQAIESVTIAEHVDSVSRNEGKPAEIIWPEANPDYIEKPIPNPVPEQICKRIVPMDEKDTTEVAIVRLFSDPTNEDDIRILGVPFDKGRHSFITIENISNSTITVGQLFLAPGKTFSLGTFSLGKTKEHNGLWFGLEARNIAVEDIYGPRVSIRCDITSSNLDMMNSLLPEFYDGWSYSKNCALFATAMWNSICSTTITGKTAKQVYDSIINTKMHALGIDVPYHFRVYHANASDKPNKSMEWN